MTQTRMTMSRTILTAALVAACAVTMTGPAGATAPGENGRLAPDVGRFEALRFEHSFDPAWSPDGQRIVFGHGRLADGTFTEGLRTMAPDGSGPAYVSPDVAAEQQADWGTAPLR